MATIKDYWYTWLWRDAISKIITINFAVWLVLACLHIFASGVANWVAYVALPAYFSSFLHRPWTIVTYMFTQVDFLHLLANMLWFMLFAQVFLQSQSARRLVVLYIYGGLAGGAVFILSHASHPYMIGASCAVMAVLAAATMLLPTWNVNLFIFGPVRILWVAVAAFVFFVVLSDGVDQMLAHLAGLAVGVLYVFARRHGVDITAPVLALCDIKARRSVAKARPGATYGATAQEEQEFDRLLDKVHRSGYSSLSTKERQRLFNLSQKVTR